MDRESVQTVADLRMAVGYLGEKSQKLVVIQLSGAPSENIPFANLPKNCGTSPV